MHPKTRGGSVKTWSEKGGEMSDVIMRSSRDITNFPLSPHSPHHRGKEHSQLVMAAVMMMMSVTTVMMMMVSVVMMAVTAVVMMMSVVSVMVMMVTVMSVVAVVMVFVDPDSAHAEAEASRSVVVA